MLVVIAFGSTGVAANAIAEGTWGALAFVIVWSPPFGYYGLRLARLAVVADRTGIVVHNRCRSRVARWSEIESISFEKRRGPWWYPVAMIWDRWIGVVRLVDGTELEVEAAESFWANSTVRLFSGRKADAKERTERLLRLWSDHS